MRTDEGPAGHATGQPILWRNGRVVSGLLAVSVLLLLLSGWRAVAALWKSWTELPEFSHGPLLPLIAAFLLWQRHETIQRSEFTGSWTGIAVVLVAGVGMLVGSMGGVYTLQQYALLAAVFGLWLAYTGRHAMVQFLMPFVMLLLMIPQPEFILNQMSAKLQLLSSGIGVALIRAAGISVFLEGNIIDLGVYRLQVVEACAGLRYLFPLMTLGLLVAYFYQGPMWKRWTVFLLSIPVTILMNSARIATVGLMVDRWGIGMAEGFIHDFQGWVVFMLSAAILIGAAALLHALGRSGTAWRDVFAVEMPVVVRHPQEAYTLRRVPASLWAALVAVVAVSIVQAVVPARPPVIPTHPPLAGFPLQVGRWHGVPESVAEEVTAATAMDDYFLAGYVAEGRNPVSLYVSYYDTQRDRRVVHSPSVCLPGSGWHIVSSDVVRPVNSQFEVNRIVIANGDNRALVYYWFDQRGRFVTNEWLVKWYLFRDALLTRRTYGALVRVITPLAPSESLDHAAERLDEFTAAAEPDLLRFIPR